MVAQAHAASGVLNATPSPARINLQVPSSPAIPNLPGVETPVINLYRNRKMLLSSSNWQINIKFIIFILNYLCKTPRLFVIVTFFSIYFQLLTETKNEEVVIEVIFEKKIAI